MLTNMYIYYKHLAMLMFLQTHQPRTSFRRGQPQQETCVT